MYVIVPDCYMRLVFESGTLDQIWPGTRTLVPIESYTRTLTCGLRQCGVRLCKGPEDGEDGQMTRWIPDPQRPSESRWKIHLVYIPSRLVLSVMSLDNEVCRKSSAGTAQTLDL
jgi:hypothetical protein